MKKSRNRRLELRKEALRRLDKKTLGDVNGASRLRCGGGTGDGDGIGCTLSYTITGY